MIRLMAACQWRTGITVYELAEQWGLSEETLVKDSAEASRYVRGVVIDQAEIRNRLLWNLEHCMAEAEKTKRYRDVIEAVKAYAGLSGVLEDHTGSLDPSEITPAKARELVAEIFANSVGPGNGSVTTEPSVEGDDRGSPKDPTGS